jgi:hypothetical protein
MNDIVIDIDAVAGLTAEERELLEGITRAKPDGQRILRKSGRRLPGPGRYVWRQIVFCCSNVNKHHCMPVMADFYVARTSTYEEWREEIKRLSDLVDRTLKTIPVSQMPGLKAWARAFGIVGE